ncbi:T9SS type A sorting domain-containing protein [uncultured Flavobacterium sp.]|uniref:T9SS type A sorting domain-containing protein n=1 Tax=uncultured Flavobacterium sp. TaxID=165435 RepID=UPI0030EE69FB
MKKNYILTLIIAFCFLTFDTYAQESKSAIGNSQGPTIEGLSIYPNPVSNGKLYITSKFGLEKEIQIFDVLGKKVFDTTTNVKEINISNLNAGVYIIKIKEKDASATRKLIIK